MTDARNTSDVDTELVQMLQRCSNWGRWGEDDQLGTLNLITPAKRVAAASLVRTGRSVSLCRTMSTERTGLNYAPVEFKMLASRHRKYESTHEWVGITPHGFSVTHLDAISHCQFDGKVYNGRNFHEICTPDGMTFASIEAQAGGIVSRGVFADVAAIRGVECLSPDEYVRVADLEEAERRAGLRIDVGDVLLVHTGLAEWERRQGHYQDINVRAGLHAECVEWMHDRGVSVFGGDCIELRPYPSAAVPMPLHMIGLAAMGLILLDWPDVANLIGPCAEEDRYEFLFVCAPLPIPGASASAVNPLALF